MVHVYLHVRILWNNPTIVGDTHESMPPLTYTVARVRPYTPSAFVVELECNKHNEYGIKYGEDDPKHSAVKVDARHGREDDGRHNHVCYVRVRIHIRMS